MNKSNLVIAVSVLLASGCALMENPPSESEPSAIVAPLAEPQAPAVPMLVESPKAETIAPRNFTVDEVRQIQMRLREAGFDPGPADGVAGARTKAALERYQAGCDKSKTLLDGFDGAGAPLKTAPDRQENQAIQLQLRHAGFDPGPADGIFGTRTRKTIAQLKTNCPLFNEAAVLLNDPGSPLERKAVVETASTAAPVKARAVSASATEASRAASAPQSKEEIRILQLRLRDAGFDPGPFDGVMGPKTIAALQQYEASDRVKKTKASLRTTQVNGQY